MLVISVDAKTTSMSKMITSIPSTNVNLKNVFKIKLVEN